jgi:hypothetical protein
MKQALLLLVICIHAGYTHAQKILLEKTIPSADSIPAYGQNYRHFVHSYIGFGFIAGPADDKYSKIKYGSSTSYYIGARYKLKLSGWYALGFDISYNYRVYRIAQTINKTIPNTLKHDKEDLRINNISLELYQRFNLNKRRGNSLGTYLDIGAVGDLVVRGVNRYTNIYSEPNEYGASTSKVRNYDLNYIAPLNYGVMMRLGINHFALYTQYRMGNMFKSSTTFSEFPRLSIGIQFNVY